MRVRIPRIWNESVTALHRDIFPSLSKQTYPFSTNHSSIILCLFFLRFFSLFLSDEGPMLETLDYTIRIGSTPTILYFDLYYVWSFTWLPWTCILPISFSILDTASILWLAGSEFGLFYFYIRHGRHLAGNILRNQKSTFAFAKIWKAKIQPKRNAIDYVHTVSFSLPFYIVLRPQGIRKQMKTLRKRHRVHIASDVTREDKTSKMRSIFQRFSSLPLEHRISRKLINNRILRLCRPK